MVDLGCCLMLVGAPRARVWAARTRRRPARGSRPETVRLLTREFCQQCGAVVPAQVHQQALRQPKSGPRRVQSGAGQRSCNAWRRQVGADGRPRRGAQRVPRFLAVPRCRRGAEAGEGGALCVDHCRHVHFKPRHLWREVQPPWPAVKPRPQHHDLPRGRRCSRRPRLARKRFVPAAAVVCARQHSEQLLIEPPDARAHVADAPAPARARRRGAGLALRLCQRRPACELRSEGVVEQPRGLRLCRLQGAPCCAESGGWRAPRVVCGARRAQGGGGMGILRCGLSDSRTGRTCDDFPA